MTPDQIRGMLAPARSDSEVLDHYGCPDCGQPMSGYANAGRTHIGYCLPCQDSWIIGANLFSSWQHETEAQQRADHERAGIPRMRRVS